MSTPKPFNHYTPQKACDVMEMMLLSHYGLDTDISNMGDPENFNLDYDTYAEKDKKGNTQKDEKFDHIITFCGPMESVESLIAFLPNNTGKKFIFSCFDKLFAPYLQDPDARIKLNVGKAIGTDSRVVEWIKNKEMENPITINILDRATPRSPASEKLATDTLVEAKRRASATNHKWYHVMSEQVTQCMYRKWNRRDAELTNDATVVMALLHPDVLDNSSACNIIRFMAQKLMKCSDLAYLYSCMMRDRAILSPGYSTHASVFDRLLMHLNCFGTYYDDETTIMSRFTEEDKLALQVAVESDKAHTDEETQQNIAKFMEECIVKLKREDATLIHDELKKYTLLPPLASMTSLVDKYKTAVEIAGKKVNSKESTLSFDEQLIIELEAMRKTITKNEIPESW